MRDTAFDMLAPVFGMNSNGVKPHTLALKQVVCIAHSMMYILHTLHPPGLQLYKAVSRNCMQIYYENCIEADQAALRSGDSTDRSTQGNLGDPASGTTETNELPSNIKIIGEAGLDAKSKIPQSVAPDNRRRSILYDAAGYPIKSSDF